MKDPFDKSTIDILPVQKKLLEKDLQKRCVAKARGRGYWVRKFASPANRSVPDNLFSRRKTPANVVLPAKFAVEFKAEGKVSTDAQREEQELMRDAGWDVYEIDTPGKFDALLDSYD